LFPERYIICLTPVIKRAVLGVRVTGGLIGYLLNIISSRYSLKSLEASNFPGVVIIGSI